MDEEIDSLCDEIDHNKLLIDPIEEYEKLSKSSVLSFNQITPNFLTETNNRYRSYIYYINFKKYGETGERIVYLIQDFLSTTCTDLKLMLYKSQAIDCLILELLKTLEI